MADRRVDFALIGGGLASASCAAALREGGADGSILLIGREPDLPYNRPPCSKGYLRGSETRDETLVQPAGWYEEHQVEALTRVSALSLDADQRVIKLSNRESVSFGQALIATGAGVRRMNVPGCELDGIFYLRTLGNSDSIREGAAGKRVVLIGGSYIACEVAASLTELGSQCTLVMLEPVALSRGFGERAGRFFQDRLQEHGITLHGEDALARFEGSDGHVRTVVTERGLKLEADAVIMGVGAVPDVSLARAAGLELGESGGVLTDSRLATSAPGVYAAGDIAEYDSVVHGRRLRIEHWDVALNQGAAVAANMLGQDRAYEVVPYFFSDLSDWASLQYLGPAPSWDREVVRGTVEEGEFSVFYLDSGRLAGALSVGRSDDLEHARRLISSKAQLGERAGALGSLDSDLAEI